MKGASTLAARIARLEARKRTRRLSPRLAFMIHHDDVPDAAIGGWRTPEGVIVHSKPGEALREALGRAWRHQGVGLSLFAVYAPEPAPKPMPGRSVPPPPALLVDRDALAGVGVIANRQLGERSI